MSAQDARAIFELALELHDLAAGRRPRITADEVLELADVLNHHQGDFRSLLRTCPSH